MRRAVARELMDEPVASIAELEGNLDDIEFSNRFLGGVAPVLREVRRARAQTLLDVCCGSGDVARELVRDAQRRGRHLVVTALDRSEQMLTIARTRTPRETPVGFVAGDALALPFADASFDAVTCNLALHHFEPAEVPLLLRELRRVAVSLTLVCDLRRSIFGATAATLWSRVCSRNRLTRHDAPLSVRRAYTLTEARAFAAAAGWTAADVRAQPYFRLTMTDRMAAPFDPREPACATL